MDQEQQEQQEQSADNNVKTDEVQESSMLGFLDSLTDTTSADASKIDTVLDGKADEGGDDQQSHADESKDEKSLADDTQKSDKSDGAQDGSMATPEETELLEGVKSERGQERIKKVFAEKKQLEQDLTEFKTLVQSTGMSPQDFAASLEFGRLINSGDEKNLKVALEMVDAQRAAICARLGTEAPGIDLLAGHDDLKKSVEDMEITREKAVELAKYRKQQADLEAQKQTHQKTNQAQQDFDAQIQQAAIAMESYLATRANEVDHPARLKMISDHFKNTANLQMFIETYQPHQWAATVKMMYDGISVPKQASPVAQPIRSRPANLGTPDLSSVDPMDRLAQRMQAMGL